MSRNYDNSQGSKHVVDMLSSYIDNALGSGEREGVRAHLETCDSCRIEHDGLTGMKAMLKNLPVMPPPRAFTLTPEMVGAGARRESFWQRLLTPRAVPRFATGSVVAFALLIFLLLGDLAGVRQNGILDPYASPSRKITSSEDAMAEERNAAIVAGLADSTATTGAAGVDDTTLAIGPPTAPTLPANAGGRTEPTTAAGEGSTSIAPFGTPEQVTSGGNTTGSETEDASAMKQPSADTYVDLGYAPPEERRENTAPVLELTLAAIGTLLAVGALVARRRGV